jgi:hypothetical protein
MPGQTQPRQANVDGITLHNLVAAAASANGVDQDNQYARGVTVLVDITAISGAGATLTVTIEGKDPVSGKYYTLLTSAGLIATGTTVLRVHPNVAVSANVAAQLPMPKTWRTRVTIVGTNPSVTAKISAMLHI